MNNEEFDVNAFYEHLRNIDRMHGQKREQFLRLLAEPCMKIPKPGDRVIIAAGLIGRGFDWVRLEVEVIAVADSSVKVRFPAYRKDQPGSEEWIHPALITDVLDQTKEEVSND